MGAEDRGFMLERSADSPSGVMVDGLAGTESGGDKVGLTHGTDVEPTEPPAALTYGIDQDGGSS